ncbi:MAG: STAS domain-containing protein [Alphaproteobacteria bacterium]|nr:STAS domain-containing protein [Alphaproteobacteria bacterium]
MEHTVSERENLVIITLLGDVDLEFSGALREILLDAVVQAAGVVVDMSGVKMIDSSGVASLLEGFQTARKRGKGFVLADIGVAVDRVLKLARLETVFEIADGVDSACQTLA